MDYWSSLHYEWSSNVRTYTRVSIYYIRTYICMYMHTWYSIHLHTYCIYLCTFCIVTLTSDLMCWFVPSTFSPESGTSILWASEASASSLEYDKPRLSPQYDSRVPLRCGRSHSTDVQPRSHLHVTTLHGAFPSSYSCWPQPHSVLTGR